MGKYIYRGSDITDIIKDKEKRIIELYSQDKEISLERSKVKYMNSTLKRAIRDVNNGLWMQSEYYILEAYGSYLDKVKVKKAEKVRKIEKSESTIRLIEKELGKIQSDADMKIVLNASHKPQYVFSHASMQMEKRIPKYGESGGDLKVRKVKRKR